MTESNSLVHKSAMQTSALLLLGVEHQVELWGKTGLNVNQEVQQTYVHRGPCRYLEEACCDDRQASLCHCSRDVSTKTRNLQGAQADCASTSQSRGKSVAWLFMCTVQMHHSTASTTPQCQRLRSISHLFSSFDEVAELWLNVCLCIQGPIKCQSLQSFSLTA